MSCLMEKEDIDYVMYNYKLVFLCVFSILALTIRFACDVNL